jgi:hypothetical protein
MLRRKGDARFAPEVLGDGVSDDNLALQVHLHFAGLVNADADGVVGNGDSGLNREALAGHNNAFRR